jgi:hypothetical protein
MSNSVDWKNMPDTTAPVPAGQYTVFIRDVGTAPAKKSGKPMATLDLEILSPETVLEAGSNVKTAGRKFKTWLVFGDTNRRSYVDAQTIAQLDLPGGELPSPLNPNDVPQMLKALTVGKVMTAVRLESEARYKQDSLGNNIIDPATGQPQLVGYNIVVKSFSPAVTLDSVGLSAPAA